MSVKNEKFEVQQEAMIFGRWHKAGDVVEMTCDQARFLLLNNTLKRPEPARKASSNKAAAKPAGENKA